MSSLKQYDMSYQLLSAFTLLILIAVPTLLLLVSSGGSAPYHVAALVGLICLALRWPALSRALTSDEKLACMGYAAFTVTILISLVDTGASKEAVGDLDVLLRPLWAIPILYLFIRTQPPEGMLWFGVSLGAMVAGINALYEVSMADHYVRANGGTSAVTYGNTALLMGIIAAVGLPYFRKLGGFYVALPIIALLLGLLGSFLSGSRGGWLAIPALVILLLWHFWRLRYQRLAVIAALVLAVIASLAVLLPQVGVSGRIGLAITQFEQYFQDPVAHGGTSVGQRLELWRAAWDMFLQQPLLGGGIGHTFNAFLREGVAAGDYHPASVVQTMPHNVLLDILALRGLVGLAGLLALWLALGIVFLKAAREPESRLRTLGTAGLALLLSYILFGLTDSVMDYGPPLVFFCLYSALIVYLIAEARRLASGQAASLEVGVGAH